MPRGRQAEVRVWLPQDVYERLLREAAVRGVSLSRTAREHIQGHLELEESLVGVARSGEPPPHHRALGAAVRLRLLDELEERIVATLGRQAERIDRVSDDLGLVVAMIDRAYLGLAMLHSIQPPKLGEKDFVKRSEWLEARFRAAALHVFRDGGPIDLVRRDEVPGKPEAENGAAEGPTS